MQIPVASYQVRLFKAAAAIQEPQTLRSSMLPLIRGFSCQGPCFFVRLTGVSPSRPSCPRAPRAGAVRNGRDCGHPEGSFLTAASTAASLYRRDRRRLLDGGLAWTAGFRLRSRSGFGGVGFRLRMDRDGHRDARRVDHAVIDPVRAQSPCSQNPSKPASKHDTTRTLLPEETSACSRFFPISASSAPRSPPGTLCSLSFPGPGKCIPTSHFDLLSSRATNSVAQSAAADGYSKAIVFMGDLKVRVADTKPSPGSAVRRLIGSGLLCGVYPGPRSGARNDANQSTGSRVICLASAAIALIMPAPLARSHKTPASAPALIAVTSENRYTFAGLQSEGGNDE